MDRKRVAKGTVERRRYWAIGYLEQIGDRRGRKQKPEVRGVTGEERGRVIRRRGRKGKK